MPKLTTRHMRITLFSSLLTAIFMSTADAGPVSTRAADLNSCLSNAGLSPVTQSSVSYKSDTAAFNQRLQPTPAAFIKPRTPAEISAAVKCASDAGVAVAARSGGHSYASYAFGGVDQQVLTIDLGNFKDISFDAQMVAKIGTGNRLGDVALALNNQGRGLPHGVCPFVGVGGHASFGGFGYASRQWGLLLDNTVAFDLVLANGTVLTHFTRNKDPDLYWALAGAAPNYAIVTAFYFKTYATPSTGIRFKYNWSNLSPADSAKAFLAYQSFGRDKAPIEMGISAIIGKDGSFELSGVHYASRDAFDSAISPLLANVPGGYQTSISEMSWIDTLQDLAGDQSLDTSKASDYRDTFFAKSLMTPQDPSKALTSAALTAFFQYLADTWTDTNWFVEVNLYGGVGSKINTKALDYNSFSHRSSLLTFQMYASSKNYGLPYDSSGVDFVNGMYGALVTPMLSNGGWSDTPAYVNYIDPTLTDDQTRNQYWGSQYTRLAQLKTRFDPQQVFKNPQSIVPA